MTSTVDRVPSHTAPKVNQRIKVDTDERLKFFEAHPEKIPRRLKELDEEWDIERAIEANASALAFTGIALGAHGDRRWLILPALVTCFLFQHAIQGWCPPVPLLRRMGFRTAQEIEQERYALKAIRGDFAAVPNSEQKSRAALSAVLVG